MVAAAAAAAVDVSTVGAAAGASAAADVAVDVGVVVATLSSLDRPRRRSWCASQSIRLSLKAVRSTISMDHAFHFRAAFSSRGRRTLFCLTTLGDNAVQIAVMTKPPRDVSNEQCVMPLRPDKGQIGAPVTVICNRYKTSINDKLPLYHYDVHISSIGGAPPSSGTEREGRKVRPGSRFPSQQLSQRSTASLPT